MRFTIDNTQGFTAEQIDELNTALAWLSPTAGMSGTPASSSITSFAPAAIPRRR